MNIGDEVEVKVNEIDSQGRINLIRNDLTYPAMRADSAPSAASAAVPAPRRPPLRRQRPHLISRDMTAAARPAGHARGGFSARKGTKPMFDFVTLPGGLRLAGERLTHVRSCTVGVWVRVGSMNELPEEKRPEPLHRAHGFQGHAKPLRARHRRGDGPRRRPAQRLHQQGMHLLLRQGDRRRASPGRDILSDLALRPVFDAGSWRRSAAWCWRRSPWWRIPPRTSCTTCSARRSIPDRSAAPSWARRT